MSIYSVAIYAKILALVNLFAFLTMGWDKLMAKNRARRIPEKVLLGQAFLFGAAGSLAGMLVFRHKTRHTAFRIGVPLALILDTAALYYLLG